MPVTPKRFSLSLVAAGFGLFGVVLGANAVIDPQQVLGTGLIGLSQLPNDRYFRFEHFLAAGDRYDGLAFGSSRGPAVPDEIMSRGMRGATFATFAVVGGQISDHLAVLEYSVRSRGPNDNKIRAVFLMLDADSVGQAQIGNRAMHTLWHPAMTGESMGRFMWRYLTAIQLSAWREAVRFAWSRWRHGVQTPPWVVRLAKQRNLPPQTRKDPSPTRPAPESLHDHPAAASTGPAPDMAQRSRIIARASFVRARPEFKHQLALLRRFVEVCRQNDIQLVVALAPLHRQNASRFDPAELEVVAQMISEIVPVWEFGSPAWLSEREDWWYDRSHFAPAVQDLMMARIFGRPTARADFGHLRIPPGTARE
jgi:hypothetical protein